MPAQQLLPINLGQPLAAQAEHRTDVRIDQWRDHGRDAYPAGQVAVHNRAGVVQNEAAQPGHLADGVHGTAWVGKALVQLPHAVCRDNLDVVPGIAVDLLNLRVVDVAVEETKSGHVAVNAVGQLIQAEARQIQVFAGDEVGDLLV